MRRRLPPHYPNRRPSALRACFRPWRHSHESPPMQSFPYAAAAASIRDERVRQRFVNAVRKCSPDNPQGILRDILRTSPQSPNASAVNG
jgi:hypothetical protein